MGVKKDTRWTHRVHRARGSSVSRLENGKHARGHRPSVLSLFAGRGGLDLGLPLAGRYDHRACVERGPAACRTLKVNRDAGLHGTPDTEIVPEDGPLQPVGKARLTAASIFSGGGGLDLGFELAGFDHVVSCDILPRACETLLAARPSWNVVCRDAREVDWASVRADVLHGGPPCQPYSAAGRQLGPLDGRDMLPAYVDAVLACRPRAYVMENVAALRCRKFLARVQEEFGRLRRAGYSVDVAVLDASGFGVPQRRRRAFFVGFLDPADARAFAWPEPSGVAVGARAALGLEPGEVDGPAPTIRSGLTGPRHTTSVNSSASAARAWRALGLWPNGVQKTREEARSYPASDGTRRLCVADCALLQGFPEDWPFRGPAYMRLGLIGNSVPPPLARSVASAVAGALHRPCSESWSGLSSGG